MTKKARGGSAALLLVVFAIAANGWMLGMPFQADDYLILPKVGEALGIEPVTAPVDARSDAQIGNFYLFRPVPWFVWWLTIKLSGGFADPVVFHAVALGFHALTSLLLWRVLRALCDPGASVIGAAFFAIAPGANQATSFIAAAGDQYAVFSMLACTLLLQRHQRSAAISSAIAAGGCAALAFLSKDVAVASLPAALLAAWAVPASRPGAWRAPLVSIAVMLALAFGARALYLKTWAPAYLVSVRFGVADLLNLPNLLLEFFAPWRRFDEGAHLLPLIARVAQRVARAAPAAFVNGVAVGAFLLPIAAGALLRPLRVVPRLVVIALLLAGVVAPALMIFDRSQSQVIARVFYPAAALCGAGLAVALEPLCSPKARRAAIAILVLPLALLSADFGVHVARTELLVGDMVHARIASLRGLAATVPRDAHVVAVDDAFMVGGIPMVYFGIGAAMRPPFARAPAKVTWWHDLATLPQSPVLLEERGPIAIARVVLDRYVLRDPLVPGLPASLPKLTRAIPDGSEWRFEAPVPARAVAAMRATLATGGVFPCTWIASRGTREARVAFPGLGGAPHAVISAPQDFDWLADPQVLGIRFGGCAVEAVEAFASLPEIRIEWPGDLERLAATGPRSFVPEVAFTPPVQPQSAAYRLTVEFAFSERERPVMISEEPAFILRSDADGRFRYDIARQASNTIVPSGGADASNFIARLGAVLEASGSGLVPLSLRIEAFDPRSGAVEARSRWRTCFLDRRR